MTVRPEPWSEPRMMTADEWNRLYPVGTPVKYFAIRGRGATSETKTRSEAWTLGSGHPVVNIHGVAGGVSLDHCVPMPKRESR